MTKHLVPNATMGVLRPRLHRRFTMITRKTPAARIAFVAAFLVLALALVPAALAGKGKPGGGGSGGGTLSLSLVSDMSGNGSANWGDTITYNVSTSATSAPSVKTTCYQNGVAVLWAQASFYAGNPFSYMDYISLQSGMWTAGGADCTAVMYYTSGKRTVTLSTLGFRVDA
jgi:hypothetical protein